MANTGEIGNSPKGENKETMTENTKDRLLILRKEIEKRALQTWEAVFEHQKVPALHLSPQEIQAWSRVYMSNMQESGRLWSVEDNAIGKIEEMTLINVRGNNATLLSAEVQSIARTFADRKLVILCKQPEMGIQAFEEKAKQELLQQGLQDTKNVHFRYAEHYRDHWARDNFLRVYDYRYGKNVFVHSTQNKRGAFAKELAEQDAEQRSIHEEVPFYFEGGDLRAVGPYLFMGEETLEKAGHALIGKGLDVHPKLVPMNMNPGEEDSYAQKRTETSSEEREAQEKILQSLGELFGRKVVTVGEGDKYEQALFHIDMFVTFLPNADQKPTVVVGDIGQTISILEQLSEKEWNQTHQAMLGSQVLLGTGKQHTIVDLSRKKEDVVREMKTDSNTRLLRRRLDAAADWFANQEFSVVRTPTVISQKHSRYRAYNNAIVEAYVDKDGNLKRKIYIPTFGISPLEHALVQKYNTLGYEVIPVPNLSSSAENRGSLNCLTSEKRFQFDKEYREGQ